MPASSRTPTASQRKGIVLALLMRLKQICNHPSQWLGDDAWAEEDSGKLARLREIAEEIAARQEKALVFTQFRETTAPLAAFLGSVFGRAGPRPARRDRRSSKRKDLVRRFQEDEDVPFFVLSLKAGGAGLNLTAASHVDPFRPLVESGCRKPGDRPCLPHRADQECAGAQVRLPRHRRGEDRPA